MNVDQMTPVTQKISAIKEIQIMQGKLGARIDILFFDNCDVFQRKLVCDKFEQLGTSSHYNECLREKTQDQLSMIDNNDEIGRAQFTLLKDHSQLYQTIELPEYDAPTGREFFAKWTPDFEYIDSQFLTDANGYDLISREVFKSGSGAFSSSFYPVDSSITITDFARRSSLTVKNDRP